MPKYDNQIVYVKCIYYGTFPYGRAAANYIRNLAIGLAAYNNVEVLIPLGAKDSSNADFNKSGKFNDVNWKYFALVESTRSLLQKSIKHLVGFIRLLFYIIRHKASKQHSIIIKYNIGFVTNLLLLVTCKLTGYKLVNIIPELYEKESAKGLAKLKWYDFYLGMRFLCRFNNGNIVLSGFMQNYIRKQGFSGPIHLVPNLVNPEEFIAQPNFYKPGKITIGYAGTPVRKDGIEDLLKCFSLVKMRFPEAHLLIIGDTHKKTVIPSLKNLSAKLQIIDDVTFTGLVDFKRVPSLLNACDILVLTRPAGIFSEAGFPTKLGEYMACKKPIVVTRVGDLKTYFDNSDYILLCNPGDIDCLASKIGALINDKKLRIETGIKGYNWMMENLHYQKVTDKLKSFIEKVCKKYI